MPVEDVARAHVTALERGRAGERYILGGENLLLDRVWELLSEITGSHCRKRAYRIRCCSPWDTPMSCVAA